ncbi:MAG: hypothetical protein ACK5QH_02245 [Rubrivivax sp.]
MHLVAVAWMYVVLMMGIVEAMSTNGTVLGAIFTVLLYGVLPLGIVLYVMGTPGRKAQRRAREAAEEAAMAAATENAAPAPQASAAAPDGGGQAARAHVTPK